MFALMRTRNYGLRNCLGPSKRSGLVGKTRRRFFVPSRVTNKGTLSCSGIQYLDPQSIGHVARGQHVKTENWPQCALFSESNVSHVAVPNDNPISPLRNHLRKHERFHVFFEPHLVHFIYIARPHDVQCLDRISCIMALLHDLADDLDVVLKGDMRDGQCLESRYP